MELDGSDLCEACLTGIYQELPTFWSQLSVYLWKHARYQRWCAEHGVLA